MPLRNKWFLHLAICVVFSTPVMSEEVLSETESVLVDQIVFLKGEIDALVLQPATGSEKQFADRILKLKGQMDRLMRILPPHAQEHLQKKLARPDATVGKPAMQSGMAGSGGAPSGSQPQRLFIRVMSPQDVARVEQSLMTAQLRELKRIRTIIKNTPSQTGGLNTKIQGQWTRFIEGIIESGMEIEVPVLVQYVLQGSYPKMANPGATNPGATNPKTKQDQMFEEIKSKFYVNLEAKLQAEIARARELASAVEGKEDAALLPEAIREKRFASGPGPGGAVMHRDGAAVSTKGELDAYIQKLERRLSDTKREAPSADAVLQNRIQSQEQALQKISDIAKMLEEAAKAANR